MRYFLLLTVIVLGIATAEAQLYSDIYANDGTYLGNTNSNQYDTNSINNPYGQYGSQYSPKSINNPYGQYGSQYSSKSPSNPYAAPPSFVPSNSYSGLFPPMHSRSGELRN